MRFFVRIPLALMCCVMLICSPAFSQRAVTVEQIIKQHDAYAKEIKSLASSFNVAYSVKRGSGWNTTRAEALLVDADKGRRAYERGADGKSQHVLAVNDGVHVYAFDGSYIDREKKTLQFREGERVAVAVYDGHYTDPMVVPLSYGYKIYDVWLSDFLRQTKMTVGTVESDARLGTLCQIHGTNLQGQAIKIWLAKDLGYVVARYECISEAGNRYVFQADGFKKVNGLWLPEAASRSVYVDGTLDASTKLTNLKHELNQDFGKLFDFVLPQGSLFHEDNKRYIVGKDGKKILDVSYIQGRSDRRAKTRPIGMVFAASLSIIILMTFGALVRCTRQPSGLA